MGEYISLKIIFREEIIFMKVIVGKMPGGRAQQIEVQEGATVLDAVRAAGYEADLNSGYEARLNNQTTTLSTIISPNSIISLAQKITGNAPAPIKLLSVFNVSDKYTNIATSMILSNVPVYLNDFLFYEEVQKDIIDAANETSSAILYVAVLSGTDLSAPQSIMLDDDDIVSFANGIEIHKDDIVCVFSPETMVEIYTGKHELTAVERLREAIALDEDEYKEEDAGNEEDVVNECEGHCECNCDHTEKKDITLRELAELSKELGITIHVDVPILHN